MFAIIRADGKQHRVAGGDRIIIDRMAAEPGAMVAFDRVLMLAEDDKDPVVGADVPEEARVFGRVVAHLRGPKLIVFKKRRRKNSRRTRGHRQDLTKVEILEISPTGEAAFAEAEAPLDPGADRVPADAVAAPAQLEPALQD